MHPKDDQLYPIGKECIWTRPSHRIQPKVVKVRIVEYGYQSPQKVGFLNYYVEIIGEPGRYAAYHSDLKTEEK